MGKVLGLASETLSEVYGNSPLVYTLTNLMPQEKMRGHEGHQCRDKEWRKQEKRGQAFPYKTGKLSQLL